MAKLTQNQINSMISSLDNVSKNAVMSPKLKEAVIATKDALKNKNFSLATDLSYIKSSICADIQNKSPRYPLECVFREDGNLNREKLGDNAYDVMDYVNFTLATYSKKLPANVVSISQGKVDIGKPSSTNHPILQLKLKMNNQLKDYLKKR